MKNVQSCICGSLELLWKGVSVCLIFASLLLVSQVSAEVLTENKTVTAPGATPYSSETDGVVLTFQMGNATGTPLSGALTGKLGVVLDITGSNTNSSRLMLTGANTFTGGLTVKNGTVYVAGQSGLGSSANAINIQNATLMVAGDGQTIASGVNIVSDYAALRASKAFILSGKVSGDGDLLIHCDDGGVVATLSNAGNDYTGLTNIGGYNVSGSANSHAALKLGANEVLPNGTTVQIGVLYGAANASTNLAASWLDLNGKTETVAALEGVGILKNTASEAGTLNIQTSSANAHSFTGTVSGNSLININVSGDGTQTLGSSFSKAALSVSDSATVSFGNAASVSELSGLTVGENASLVTAANAAIAVDGNISLAGNIGTSPLTINETGTGRIILSGTKDYSNLTVNVNDGSVVYLNTNNANLVMGANSKMDLDGQSLTFATLPNYNFINSNATTRSTLTFGNSTGDDTFSGTFANVSGGQGIALVKTGSNTVTFTGTSSAVSLAVGSGAVVLGSTANLTFSGSVTAPSASAIVWNAGASLRASSLSVTGNPELDLKGANLTLSTVPASKLTNTNAENVSVFTYNGSSGATIPVIGGNTRFVLNMTSNYSNASRITSTAGSNFGGGVEIQSGTFRVNAISGLGTLPKLEVNGTQYSRIDFNGGSLMTPEASISDSYAFYMMENGGSIRSTGSGTTFSTLFTGPGHLEIVNDSVATISNTKNDYQGWTYLGFHSFRSDGLGNGGGFKLGNSEVLPNSTVVQISGGNVSGTLTMDLNGKTETVAGLTGGTSSGGTVNGIVTSAVAGGTLILNDSTNYTYSGKITGSANITKTGSALWSVTGPVSTSGTISVENGTVEYSNSNPIANVVVSGNATSGKAGSFRIIGAGSLASATVSQGGTLSLYSSGSVASVNMNGGTTRISSNQNLDTAAFSTQEGSGNSVLVLEPPASYLQEKFESPQVGEVDSFYHYAGELTENANQITNMDAWVNKGDALRNQTSSAIWGELTDKSVTNVFQISLKNKTDSDIVLDFGKSFRNDVNIVISEGETTVETLDWSAVDVTNYSIGTLENVVFEAGKEYTLTLRASRYHQTIGPSWTDGINTYSGLNNSTSDLIGVGVRQSGETHWVGLNLMVSGELGWVGSGLYAMLCGDVHFAPMSLNIADGTTLTVMTQAGVKTTLATDATGSGTMRLMQSGGGISKVDLAANLEGGLSVGENVLLTNSKDVTLDGNLTLESASSMYQINGASGTLTAKNLTGNGVISIDLDSAIADSAQAMITLTETNSDNIDLAGLSLEFNTNGDLNSFLGKNYSVFNDTVDLSGLNYDSYHWLVTQNDGKLNFSLNGGSVPEPSTWCLLLFGLAVVGLWRGGRKTVA